MNVVQYLWAAVAVFLFCVPARAQNSLKFADLGTCPLQEGGAIENCTLGYRTFGRLNGDRSNGILFPTWFTGTSAQLVGYLGGPDAMVDTTAFYVVLVDAFGDGISSSPSNSETQPGKLFPLYTVRDMVHAEHRLLTERLGIDHLHAVMGISMGGMQTFEWLASYPDFMDRAIPIVGTPKLSPYDVLLWQTELLAIRALASDSTTRDALRIVAGIHSLALETPDRVSAESMSDFDSTQVQRATDTMAHDPYDWASQLQAMIFQDIYEPFGDDPLRLKPHLRAQVLVIVNDQDHMVNPRYAKAFAREMGAELVELNSNCGHLVFSCNGYEVTAAVAHFLKA